jgi:hypothetical protein
MATFPLRLLVFDRTCLRLGVGLSTAWSAGSVLYRALGRVDAARGVASWNEALGWIASFEPDRPIAEIQYWGHGRWGRVLVGDDVLDASALLPHAPHARSIAAIRERLLPGGASLLWLRTCEAFGAIAGQDLAQRLADSLGARVAGHTFVIGALQSGLRALAPGGRPQWSSTEGLAEGTAEDPRRALGSAPWQPRTVSCFSNEVPAAWFVEDSTNEN